ncbi:MAG TPA: imidazole glycerol phosphate synthase subunit HisH [Actinomycetota bacterium]|nr:imidazole glycerol phosphate synthase subunit HisH [Actinomycetota bacterium]
MTRVAILDYGMGNLRSVARAIEHVGGKAIVATDPEGAAAADALVVPGVGAFAACVERLRARDLDQAIRGAVDEAKPTLGVCLGMQILFEHGEEGDAEGLGLLPGDVPRLPSTVKVPHMGWNTVEWVSEHALVRGVARGSRFYFVHSYVCRPRADVDVVGEAEHGVRFPAVVARGSLVATQFHPEKSGEAGLRVYRNFIEAAA